MKFETLLIHGGIDGDEHTGAVSVPIYQTSTYRQAGIGENKGYDYSRAINPTREALEKLIAEMENGVAGYAFASGMAAITAVLMLFKSDDKILISNNIYGGTYRVIDKVFNNFNLKYEIIDTNDENEILSKIDESVKAIFIETPTNPLLNITDISKVSSIAKKHKLLTIVDNTFMTPYLQNPIDLGADIVIHSATKYLGGHSDLIAGLVVVNNDDLSERLYFIQKSTGGILNPSDAWLLIRGIKTLSVRMDRHIENSDYIVESLLKNEAVKNIYYPGLVTHPGHDIQKKQARSPGAIISFSLTDEYDINKFFKALKYIMFGESLGGVESIITHPASMTHASIPYEVRQKIGIVDNLIRLSVGIENKFDLIEDIENAIISSKVK
ncbi:trans-sulfuration enzyme family protein [Clostridium sp. UBA1652]|uniref:trans-sulfuration enzyme family protein n=1 Tax=Clostridium sp. UBA1652 TaxID=1946348 RepID=UPI00257C6BD2|nr:aminotransferase class I/II-fold pyridoxal phosphate-dependent enzyme [Clostridium sp. UBA1652]